MKLKSFWLFISIPFFTSIMAQKSSIPTSITGIHPHYEPRSISDTINEFFNADTVTIYASPSGGFVSGNSGYGEIAKGQEFDVDSTDYFIVGGLYWFGYKTMESEVSDSSYLTMSVWKKDTTIFTIDSIYTLPRTRFLSTKLYINDLVADTNYSAGLNLVNFTPTDPFVDYLMGFSMEGLHIKDTIALFSTRNEDVEISAKSWEKWGTNWNTIKNAWGLDIDFAVFPLIDNTTAAIENINGISFELFPNPVVDYLTIHSPDFEGMNYSILDMNGKLIYQLNANETNTSISTSNFPNGTYILLARKGKIGYAKKFLK